MSDLQEVFVIKTAAELDDETAESMESQIVTNQDFFAFFTNFDHWSDYVALSLWIGGLTSLLIGAALIFKGDSDESSSSKWGDEPESTDFTGEVEEELEESNEVISNTYNVQNITIQDSVVLDSNFTNNSEEEREESNVEPQPDEL